MSILNIFGSIDPTNPDRGSEHCLGRMDSRQFPAYRSAEDFLRDFNSVYSNLSIYDLSDSEVESREKEWIQKTGESLFDVSLEEIQTVDPSNLDDMVLSIFEWLDDPRIKESDLRAHIENWEDVPEEIVPEVEIYSLQTGRFNTHEKTKAIFGLKQYKTEVADLPWTFVPVDRVDLTTKVEVEIHRLPNLIAKDKNRLNAIGGKRWFAEFNGIEFFGRTQKDVRILLNIYHAAVAYHKL